MLLILFAAIGNHSSPSRKMGRSRAEDKRPAEGEGTREGGKEREGQPTCIHPLSTSPSVSLLLLVKKNLQHLPLPFTIVVAYLKAQPPFFFCIQSVHRTKKGMAVNNSANEPTNLGGFSSVVDLSHTSKCFISFMS